MNSSRRFQGCDSNEMRKDALITEEVQVAI